MPAETTNVWPGRIKSPVILFNARNSATVRPFAVAIRYKVSPRETETVLAGVSGSGVGSGVGSGFGVGVGAGVVVPAETTNVWPGVIKSPVKLFNARNSATVKPFAVAMRYKVSPR